MSQKRQPDDGKVGSKPEEKRQKVPALRNVILEAMKMNAFQKFLSGLEPLIRKVVKEEVEVALKKHFSKKQSFGNQVHPSSSRSLELQFRNKLSLPVFTGSKIEGGEGSIVEVALVDTLTDTVVLSGPESSAKVEIVVLEGDFELDDDGSWTVEVFNNNIVKEREGKRPLLTGDCILNLKEGIGGIGDLFFTDNSSWTRSRKFRLGARVVGDNYDGIRIREAMTESFVVKDHRGELHDAHEEFAYLHLMDWAVGGLKFNQFLLAVYKKHYPPSLADEVWRLEKIGKDGAFHKRLNKENVNTVKDFLTLLFGDALRLRNILGTGMSSKMWEITVEHAQTCILDKRMYVYHPTSAQQGVGVVFNVVGQILGILSAGQYITVDKISETEEVNAQRLVKLAYEHWDEVVSFDAGSMMDGSFHIPALSFPSSLNARGSSFTSQIQSSHNSDEVNIAQLSDSSSDVVSSILSLEGFRNTDITLPGYDNMDLRYDHFSSFTDSVANSIDCDAEAMVQSFCGDHTQYYQSDTSLLPQNFCLESQADLQAAVSGFIASSARSAVAATADKAQTKWSVLYSVLRWRFSIRRIVASKKSGGRESKR
ncbi:hypothetical protein IFM89_026278 [Coptis chinensis]|uniref:Calmodulin-binding protein n=1 Tax=Coptis chinensis TaxID=261450 RepID=A0A835IYE1_9MAGN|nr:hypothetical protein IFM89_026278 [Coptis chinensis]